MKTKYIVRENGKFEVKDEKFLSALKVFDTEEEATNYVKELYQSTEEKFEVQVQQENGEFANLDLETHDVNSSGESSTIESVFEPTIPETEVSVVEEEMIVETEPTESVVEEVATPETPVVEEVATPETPVVEEVATPETPVVEEVATPETPVVEEVATPETPVVEEVATPETPVVEEVATPETPVVEEVATPETPVVEETPVETKQVEVATVTETAVATATAVAPADAKVDTTPAEEAKTNETSETLNVENANSATKETTETKTKFNVKDLWTNPEYRKWLYLGIAVLIEVAIIIAIIVLIAQ